jgi:uncharacterized protein (TIGR02001 family)
MHDADGIAVRTMSAVDSTGDAFSTVFQEFLRRPVPGNGRSCGSRRRLTRWPFVAMGLLACAASHAEWTSTGQLRFASNYIFRGYAKSDDNPVVQIHAGAAHDSGAFGGVWATALDYGGAQLEFVPYVGVQRNLSADVRVEAVVSGYIYDAQVFGRNVDYAETTLGIDWRNLLSARLSAAFDSYGSKETTFNAELEGRYPLNDVAELVAALGYDAITLVTDYDVVYWNVGLRYFLGAHVVAELRYFDDAYVNEFHRGGRDSPFSAAETSGRTVFSISIGF